MHNSIKPLILLFYLNSEDNNFILAFAIKVIQDKQLNTELYYVLEILLSHLIWSILTDKYCHLQASAL